MAGTNAYGFKAQPTNDSNPMANYLQSSENSLSTSGAVNTTSGQATANSGVQAFGPVLQYLTALTKGDQGDVAQATQPQVNQIKDSFSAIRNMISQQPRGGGKAGVLAEQGSQQTKQVGDMQSQARQGAVGELGTVANQLAGIGIQEQNVGLGEQSLALGTAVSQRGQNAQNNFASQFAQIAGGIHALV